MSGRVLMYTTAVCPYCIRAKQLLKARGVVEIEEVRIDLDPVRRDEMMEKPGAARCRKSILAIPTSVVATI